MSPESPKGSRLANFLDFLRITEREQKPRRLTYVCGNQPALREEVIDAVRVLLDVNDLNFESLSADTDKPQKIWASINQYPTNFTERRLVLVREADRLTKTDQLHDWLKSRHIPNVHVVMASSQYSWPEDRDPKTRELMMKSAGAIYVQCNLPKSDPTKTAVEIITNWAPISRDVAAHLADRAGHDMARIRDVCRWLKLFKGEITPQHVDSLIQRTVTETFVDSLTQLDRGTAAEVAQELDSNMQHRTIGQLSQRLTILEQINRSMQHALARTPDQNKFGIAQSETAKHSGVPITEVKKYWSSAKHYDPPAVMHRTALLARADTTLGKPGVMELLAMQW